MEKVKQLWTLAKANPKISIAIVVAIVAVYFLANQTRGFMLHGLSKREYSCDLRTDQERVSL